jgi:2-hydroxy-6-oxonona-2,4-dienedioate hydrolase
LTRVLEAGAADGVPTVLLHGVGARADRGRGNLEPLAAYGLHVFALDLPGHGFATKGEPAQDYSVDGYARFLEQFLDSIEADRVVLVGTSLGGHVAAAAACRMPERVSALILVGTLGLVPLGAAAREQIAGSLADVTEAGVRAKLERVVHDRTLVTDEWVAEEMRINSSPGAAASFAALAAYFREHIDGDLVGDQIVMSEPPPPMLLIWGGEDEIVSVSSGEAAREVLGSHVSLEVIAATGHAPYLEAPALFNRVVTAFLLSANVLSDDAFPSPASAKEE